MRSYRLGALTLACTTVSAGMVYVCHAESYPTHRPVPGGVAVIELNVDSNSEVSARFGRTPILTMKNKGSWFGVVGIGLDTAQGNYLIMVNTAASEDPIIKEFSVIPHGYPLKAAHDHTVPTQSLHFAHNWRPKLDASFPLSPPVATATTVPFGTRYTEGDDMQPQRWTVFRLTNGQEIIAPGEGVVADIFKHEQQETFYVTIDHGMGLYSSVGPLRRLRAKNGQEVSKGEVLGAFEYDKSGSRAVYWKTVLNGVAVDPFLFTDQTSEPKDQQQ